MGFKDLMMTGESSDKDMIKNSDTCMIHKMDSESCEGDIRKTYKNR